MRDRLFARTFGAGPELDAYNAAFVLPELVLDVLVASGLAAPFVPIFLRLRAGDGDEEAFGQTILTGATGVMVITAVVLFVLAPQTTGLIAPGFSTAQHDLYVGLFRVMLVTPILFAASLALGEVLLAERRFLAYGAAPLLYNAGIVVGDRSPWRPRSGSSAQRLGPCSALRCTWAFGCGDCAPARSASVSALSRGPRPSANSCG